MTDATKRMVLFGFGQQNEVPAADFGNKAASLAAMAGLGVPVPPGFALSVVICQEYFRNSNNLSSDVSHLLHDGISFLERITGSSFGGRRRPLLVSVRSGAPVSMPGIMDTILNIGLTPLTVRGLLSQTGNPRFVYDTYRRFLENFGTSIFKHNPLNYRVKLKEIIAEAKVNEERELDFQSLKNLCYEYEQFYTSSEEQTCLNNAFNQLMLSTIAVIQSWMSPRSEVFRQTHFLQAASGTAITIQAMVFGNMGASSGAGVAFTRNPWTGAKDLLIDFRFGAQGEDVVSGDKEATIQTELAETMPDVYRELLQFGARLEAHYQDMQDLEFTVQEERLYLLQSRAGKRSALAALQIAIDLCNEGIIPRREALERVRGIALDSIEIQKVQADEPPLAHGTSASGGVAHGTIAFSSERAVQDSKKGSVILVRETASPDDIAGIDISVGLLTARGARTSHAAVVARQLGKVCVVNCTDLTIDAARHRCSIGNQTIREGESISIDGNSGSVYRGSVSIISERPTDLITTIKRWQKELK